MIYITSDFHFNHKNILKYEKETRPFETIEEMNEVLIENWNKKVEESDTVYMLGDIFMGLEEQGCIGDIMNRLKGKKILIKGNHDTNRRIAAMSPYLEGVYDMYNLKYDKRTFVLCHYPLKEWYEKEYGAIHLYGHVHSNDHRNGEMQEGRACHIGIDTNQLRPISIVEIMNKFYPCKHKTRLEDKRMCLDCGKKIQKFTVNGNPMWI